MKLSKFYTLFTLGLLGFSQMFAQIPSYVPTNGLMGWYPFNGNANDESGNGNNGTVTGATLTADRFGVANRAYLFGGFNNFINVPNSPSLASPTNEVTIAFWGRINGFYTFLIYQS